MDDSRAFHLWLLQLNLDFAISSCALAKMVNDLTLLILHPCSVVLVLHTTIDAIYHDSIKLFTTFRQDLLDKDNALAHVVTHIVITNIADKRSTSVGRGIELVWIVGRSESKAHHQETSRQNAPPSSRNPIAHPRKPT